MDSSSEITSSYHQPTGPRPSRNLDCVMVSWLFSLILSMLSLSTLNYYFSTLLKKTAHNFFKIIYIVETYIDKAFVILSTNFLNILNHIVKMIMVWIGFFNKNYSWTFIFLFLLYIFIINVKWHTFTLISDI